MSEASESHHGAHTLRGGRELAAVSSAPSAWCTATSAPSPLYAMRECLASPHAVPVRHDNVLGVVSLMFWALTLVIVGKYLIFILRADNKGEGGTVSLAALVTGKQAGRIRKLGLVALLAMFATGLLFGDGMVTPAISILGAIEGISEQNPSLSTWVVPLTVAILIGLFMVQRFGTARIGSVFGWITLVWFLAIGALGLRHILARPEVLEAVNPYYGVRFFLENGWHGFLLLGSVLLVVTGGEALYADMGHFGKKPIRLAWFTIAFPGLLLNYFGQGALFLSKPPGTVDNPFYELVPPTLLVPMIVLATMAAIIASQAMISGAFSVTNQAIQLGYLPRMTIVHTSGKSEGQIYIPEVTYILMVACVALVLAFKTSSNLAAAYGIAVTGTMLIGSCLFFRLVRVRWGWSMPLALAVCVPMILIDTAFFSACVTKVSSGGWFPLAIGVGMFVLMTTWWRGRLDLSTVMDTGAIDEPLFLADIAGNPLPRVPGTAVFMASSSTGIPNVLMHHVKHNKVLHQQVVLFSIETDNVPFVFGERSLTVSPLEQGFFRVVARCGFMQQPNVPRILARAEGHGLTWNPMDTTYYLGRQTLIVSGRSKLARWRKVLFSFLARNSRPPTDFFQLPPNRVVELGLQIEL
ncbi:MAG: potassium transporter Kup [Kofleriaceae bacterium]